MSETPRTYYRVLASYNEAGGVSGLSIVEVEREQEAPKGQRYYTDILFDSRGAAQMYIDETIRRAIQLMPYIRLHIGL